MNVMKALAALPVLFATLAQAGTGTITVDPSKPGPRIPASLYGIFFEEISHAGEGGLYAELIQNRGFEDANLPPACKLEGRKVVPPATPSYWDGRVKDWTLPWNVESRWPAWSLETTGGGAASIDLVDTKPLTDATPHSLEVRVTSAAGRVALLNTGFWGIAVKQGESYKLSFHGRAENFRGPITAALESADGRVLATASIAKAPGSGWQRFETTLTATATDPKARFAMKFGSTGTVWLDMVSLFPAKTFKNRPNGMRVDLAETVAALKPAFVRFPGGCYVEGITIESRPQWKRTLGRLEDRPGTYSPWGYWSTDGLGYHEFLQFSEDIGASALYVVNAGISCAFRSATFIPDEDLEPLIQDTLDAIEYAVGPAGSKYGAMRAAAGHPAPFPLKYIEVGNEDQGARYGARFARFYKAIHAKYPQIEVALDSWIAGIDRQAIDAAGKFEIFDEHAYKPLNWAIENFDSFAQYAREGWKLYIGEFATNTGVGRGNLIAALNDVAYMMSMEKNSDLVHMGSYAPLLENVNKRDWDVNLIHFDSSRLFARASYYAAKLFAEHRPDVNLPAAVKYESADPRPVMGKIGLGTWNTSAEYKDVRVESGGRVLYASDFSEGTAGWQTQRGTWSVQDGAYRQKDNTVAFAYFGEADWKDVTITAKARKLGGSEGFLIVAGTADGRQIRWNVAGWNNRQSAIQAGDAIEGPIARGRVETDRWYDLKVEVRGRTLRCWMDGKLVNEYTLPRVDTVLAIAGKDERTGETVIKVVNSSGEPAKMDLRVPGAGKQAKVWVLSSANPTDENSFEEPMKIAPRESREQAGTAFSHEFPPYSLTVIRI